MLTEASCSMAMQAQTESDSRWLLCNTGQKGADSMMSNQTGDFHAS